MRTIIAGSRSITDYGLVKQVIIDSGFNITTVISGHAEGVDKLGEQWSREVLKKPPEIYKPDWNNVNVPNAVIKTSKWGKPYNANAGKDRNTQMAQVADACIVIHNGSPGSRDMLAKAHLHNLKVFEVDVRVSFGSEEAGEAIQF